MTVLTSAAPPDAPSAPTQGHPTAPVFLLLAELGLLAMAAGTAAGFNRLFLGWDFLGSLLLAVVASWGSAVVMRRLRWPVRVALPVSLLLAVLVITWRFAPETSVFGLPTPETASVLGAEVREAFSSFSRLVAPVEVTEGFLVVLASLLWVFGFFADTGAFRFHSPVQAVVPYFATFAAAGILARGDGRTGAAMAFGAGLVLYAVTQRAMQASERRWIRGENDRGAWAVLAVGAGLAALAVLAGVVLGPRLPGDTEAVVDLRALGREGGSRTVVSPFVGVRSLLGEQSDEVLFTVEADAPAYWRLTSLEQYDASRDIWVSRGTYRRVDGDLDPALPPDVAVTPLRQQYRITGLGGLWMPAAYQPALVDADEAISFDEGSSSVIARTGSLSSGTGYAVDSALPSLDRAALSADNPRDSIDARYTEDPSLSDQAMSTARSVTAGASTNFDKALALQDFFRDGFTYDERVNYRDDPNPVDAFLNERAGFCQQFASTYALMARSIGLPARVAVGFTPGDQVDLSETGLDGTTGDEAGPEAAGDGDPRPGFIVRGRHAHAWPEVYFDGVGWVPFEPTPSRGNPQTGQYTGVAPEQAETPAQQAATTTTVPVTTAPSEAAATTVPSETPSLDAVADPDGEEDRGGGDGVPAWAWPVALVGLAIAVVAVRALLRSRRRRRLLEDPHGGRIAAAWDDAVDWLALTGVSPRPSETPGEFAQRARGQVGVAEIDDLARAETSRRFGPGVPPDDVTESAEHAAVAVKERVRATVGRRRRWSRWFR